MPEPVSQIRTLIHWLGLDQPVPVVTPESEEALEVAAERFPRFVAAVKASRQVQPPVIRSATVAERIGDRVLDVYEAAAAQPLGRVADALGLSDLSGMVASATEPIEVMTGTVDVGPKPTKGIRAFHGSPHDFDKFSLEKIGTGEGAQAYGHGLYFAEKEGTAKSYRNANAPAYQNTHIANLAYEAQRAAEAATGLKGTAAKPAALKWLSEEAAKATPYQRQSFYDAANNYDAVMSPPTGKMYEVNINADPETLLDWDAPLSQQSPQVRAVMEEVGLNDANTGRQFYNTVGQRRGEFESMPATRGITAQHLKSRGIPGIKYLDQGSRAAGEGTRNFVIFDEDTIEILRKYGLLLPATGLGGAVAAQDR